ncbi:holin family protein [Paracoccus sp. TK19116]|uniref:Holin family protein n=1 Tax=Paracoccus albicereus TaxID=2922394 RepID=A0ABT1MU41_9RHOB|nr:holin family protein [Paracoccus albicereus]MCQ0971848.1 holin family protein [Paracoccus albicereus]
MGVIDRFINVGAQVSAVGTAASNVAEVFTQNATRRMELDEEAYARAISQHGQEFGQAPKTWFDSLVNGMNRLPRPMMTLGVLGLFVYAMAEPVGFSLRMEGLALVPEPLWWLLGAIVSFYFGAREAHYFRGRVWPTSVTKTTVRNDAAQVSGGTTASDSIFPTPIASAPAQTDSFADNAALRDWTASLRG